MRVIIEGDGKTAIIDSEVLEEAYKFIKIYKDRYNDLSWQPEGIRVVDYGNIYTITMDFKKPIEVP